MVEWLYYEVWGSEVVRMIFYEDKWVRIRNMEERDAIVITEAEISQGWNASVEKYYKRLKDQEEGRAIAFVGEFEGSVAGDINLYLEIEEGPFAGSGAVEIVDFGVLERYRNLGIGSRLMDVAESVAGRYSDRVCLGVGLHCGYGSAQRMYVKRGYIPDGSGVWYGGKVCEPYSDCNNDDELVLYLSKRL
ncbi:MAG: GNAT family N-acetyltransferase [Bariatricus sp.]